MKVLPCSCLFDVAPPKYRKYRVTLLIFTFFMFKSRRWKKKNSKSSGQCSQHYSDLELLQLHMSFILVTVILHILTADIADSSTISLASTALLEADENATMVVEMTSHVDEVANSATDVVASSNTTSTVSVLPMYLSNYTTALIKNKDSTISLMIGCGRWFACRWHPLSFTGFFKCSQQYLCVSSNILYFVAADG